MKQIERFCEVDFDDACSNVDYEDSKMVIKAVDGREGPFEALDLVNKGFKVDLLGDCSSGTVIVFGLKSTRLKHNGVFGSKESLDAINSSSEAADIILSALDG